MLLVTRDDLSNNPHLKRLFKGFFRLTMQMHWRLQKLMFSIEYDNL